MEYIIKEEILRWIFQGWQKKMENPFYIQLNNFGFLLKKKKKKNNFGFNSFRFIIILLIGPTDKYSCASNELHNSTYLESFDQILQMVSATICWDVGMPCSPARMRAISINFSQLLIFIYFLNFYNLNKHPLWTKKTFQRVCSKENHSIINLIKIWSNRNTCPAINPNLPDHPNWSSIWWRKE